MTVSKSSTENLTDNSTQSLQPILTAPNITLYSGYDIPDGRMPDRQPTYDDIVHTPGAGLTYRGNIQEYGKSSQWQHVNSKTISFEGFQIGYRDDIETGAGQIRTIVIHTEKDGVRMMDHEVILKLAGDPKEIQVRKIDQSTWYIDIQAFMIEIPTQIKPEDYRLDFLYFIDGRYCATLTCTIHVVK